MKRAVWRNLTMQAAEALRAAAVRLSDKSDTPRLDAELLLAHALGIEQQELLLKLRDVVVPSEFAQLVGVAWTGNPLPISSAPAISGPLLFRLRPPFLSPARTPKHCWRPQWSISAGTDRGAYLISGRVRARCCLQHWTNGGVQAAWALK